MQLSCPNTIPCKLSWCSTCMSSLKLIGETVFKLESRNHTRTDGQTDVGHINLIGGLVTHNPPKKGFLLDIYFLQKEIKNIYLAGTKNFKHSKLTNYTMKSLEKHFCWDFDLEMFPYNFIL